MRLVILSSESLGNGYILEAKDGTLLIEAGVPLGKVKKALDYDLSGVVGCICSHGHFDHIKYANEYSKAGISIYTSQDAIDSYKPTRTHRFHNIHAGVIAQLGPFKIVPFDVHHGVRCYGYLIAHSESGKILFVTDAAYIKDRFVGLSQILVEANYSTAELTNERAVGHHMDLDTAIAFLKANDLSGVHNIVLLHLSASNSNARDFTKAVQDVAPGAKVWVGDKNLELELSRHPF